jgi:IS5 family transposase
MKQSSFSDAEFDHKRKQRRRDRFLAEFKAVTPVASSDCRPAALLHERGGGRGRPVGLEHLAACFGFEIRLDDAIYSS